MRDNIKIQYEDTPILTPVLKCTGYCSACSNQICLLI